MTVPTSPRFDERVTGMLGCGFTAHELLLMEVPTCSLQPRSKGQVAFAGAVKHVCPRTQGHISAGLGEQLVSWKLMWPCISPLLWASAWKAGKQTCSSWGLKNSFQPQKLNWTRINHSLSGKVAVTEQLCADHGSATLHKWRVRLPYPAHINRNPTGTRRRVISEENGSPFTSSIYSSWRNQLFRDWHLLPSKLLRHHFPGTPLGTLQPLALLQNAPWSTWPSLQFTLTQPTSNRWLM